MERWTCQIAQDHQLQKRNQKRHATRRIQNRHQMHPTGVGWLQRRWEPQPTRRQLSKVTKSQKISQNIERVSAPGMGLPRCPRWWHCRMAWFSHDQSGQRILATQSNHVFGLYREKHTLGRRP